MLFFLNLDGTMTRADNERIFQGSTQVPEIQVLSTVSTQSGGLQISFTLPNGLVTPYFPMIMQSQFENAQGFKTYLWGLCTGVTINNEYITAPQILKLLGNITEQEGTVGVSVQQTNAQTGRATASYTSTFVVEYSALPQLTEAEKAVITYEDLFALLGNYYQQNEALLASIGGDYTSLVARMDQAEENIDALKTKTTDPLLGDITFDLVNNVGTKYFKDGTTATFPIANSYTVINRDNFLKILSFTASSGWTQNADGTYELGFSPTQTERTNSACIIALDVPNGTGFNQTANGVFKGSDGSVLIFGATEPFAGRLCILAGSGSGTQIFNGTSLSASTLTTADSDLLQNAFIGDFYYNTTTGDWLKCTARSTTITTWQYLCNFKPTITLNGTQVFNASFYAPLGGGTIGNVLISNGANNSPYWTSFKVNGANLGNTTIFAPISSGSSGNVLQSGGANNAPAWYAWTINGSAAAGNKTLYAPTASRAANADNSVYALVPNGTGTNAPIWAQFTLAYDSTNLKYTLNLGGKKIGEIQLTQEIYLDSISYNDNTKMLTFTFNTASGKQSIQVDMSDLADVYTAGNGINVVNNAFSIKLKTGEANLVVDSNGLSLNTTNLLAKNGTATLLANGWTLSGSVYTQSITVSSVGVNDTLLVAGASANDCLEMQTANVFYATASGTTATFTSKQEPTADIDIEYTIVRGQS